MFTKFTFTIECDNAAFSDANGDPWPYPEVARILRATADRVEKLTGQGNMRDVNGNTVGGFKFAKARRRAA